MKAKYLLPNFFCIALKLFHMRSLRHRGLVVGNLLSLIIKLIFQIYCVHNGGHLVAGSSTLKSTGWLWSPTMIMSQAGPGHLPHSAEVHCMEERLLHSVE